MKDRGVLRTSAKLFFSNHLIGLLAGPNGMQVALSETSSSAPEGFSFDYAVASRGLSVPGPIAGVFARPDFCERWPSGLVATAAADWLSKVSPVPPTLMRAAASSETTAVTCRHREAQYSMALWRCRHRIRP